MSVSKFEEFVKLIDEYSYDFWKSSPIQPDELKHKSNQLLASAWKFVCLPINIVLGLTIGMCFGLYVGVRLWLDLFKK